MRCISRYPSGNILLIHPRKNNASCRLEARFARSNTLFHYIWNMLSMATKQSKGRRNTSGTFFFFFFFFHLTYSRWTSSLPSCLWSQRIFPSLPGSRLTIFLSRCKFSTLTTRQSMVEFYLLTFPRFPLRKKEHKSYLGKNRTHDFRTSRCAAYLLDHSVLLYY